MAYTTINKSTDYFNTKLYTGNGSTNAITGVGFQPDLVWCKNRTSAQSHAIVDSIRGRKGLQSNATDAEYVMNANRDFGTFDSDGFTVYNPEQLNSFNFNGGSIASWNWKANGAGSANTAGSINSTVSASTTSGFSIVSYTGTGSNATVGHGLGVVPSMFITKELSSTSGWVVWHKSIGTSILELNGTGASQSGSTYINGTIPTNSFFTISTSGDINQSGANYIAYCFAEKQGYSKFGSYVGNGNADGSFVYTGFKPAFIIAKRTDSADDWRMITKNVNTRNTTSNVIDRNLMAHNSNAESSTIIDFVSNGMKIRNTSGGINASGGSFIYMAFAEAPLVGSNNVPCTAR